MSQPPTTPTNVVRGSLRAARRCALALVLIAAPALLQACTKVVDARGIGAEHYQIEKSDLEGGLFGDPPRDRGRPR